VPEEDARWYAGELEGGRVVVTVRGGDAERAAEVLHAQAAGRPQSGRAAYGRAHDRAPEDAAIPGHGLPATPY
jgi:hypothetical protein